MLWGLPRLPIPFIPLTWGPKPISALWQWGCSSRPVQKTRTPPLTPPNSCPGVDGPNLDMDRTGRRYRVPVLRKAPGLCTCPNYYPSAKPGGWVTLGPVGPMSQASPSPSGLTCHQGDQLILGSPGLSPVYTDHLLPWIPCNSQGNWDGWSPYMSPRLRPAEVLVSLPVLPPPHPIEALRTPRLAAFTPSAFRCFFPKTMFLP